VADGTGGSTGGAGNTDIALVGMAGRFPGADDVGELWESIRAGRSGITRFTDDELRAVGVPAGLLADTAYVRAGAVISDIDQFDAAFFGISQKEAQILDPQHRLFLEHSWLALEDAGCAPARFAGAIGVFAGCAWSSYLASNLTPAGTASEVGELAVALANEKDCLPLRTAHLLGLSGPAFGVQSNCSTSLVAVCAAASSLASFECDAALAGGAAISVPHRVGYLYQPGGIAPPDGQCRAFDAAGLGAPLGSGVGVVVLRRLEDALADGDRIYAVLRGWAVNNDAGRKAGFTAPGVDGQASVIAEALAVAGLRPADIDYIEAHGTGTMLGDAAELAALQRVFRGEAVRIGSIKTNIGHLDRAAGVTGLIKVALALHHGEIPATLNLTEPNPQLAEGQADLTVVTERQPWPRSARPRRAGVSAFGIGGTNAHVVLEEAPLAVRPPTSGGPELLIWSARSAVAADQATARLARYLENTAAPLSDIASTLQRGRDVFEHRRILVTESAGAAAVALRQGAALSREDSHTGRPVTFLISGAGAVYTAVAADLYPAEPEFRVGLDQCRDLITAATGTDPLAGVLASRPPGAPEDGAAHRQAAEFAAGYALARLVLGWTRKPGLILGQGLGEYIAASLAGVLTLADALALVIRRAELLAPEPDGTGAGRPEFPRAELASWVAAQVTLKPPAIPLVCASTGLVITPEQAAGPDHWAGVSAEVSPAALATVLASQETALLELGSGESLISLAREHPDCPPDRRSLLIPALPAAGGAKPATVLLAEAIGRLWLAGVTIDWAAYGAGRPASRVSLPAYPFQRKSYWINPPAPGASTPAATPGPGGADRAARPAGPAPDVAEGADRAGEYVQVLAQRWDRAGPRADRTPVPGQYVILPDTGGVGDALAGLLRQAGSDVVIAPDGQSLAAAVAAPAGPDGSVIICLTALDEDDATAAVVSVARILACSAADGAGTAPVLVVTRGGQAVTGTEPVRAAQAAVTVLPIVASQEYLNLTSRSVDLDPGYATAQAAAALAAELSEAGDPVVAYRASHRLRPSYSPAEAGPPLPGGAVRTGGRYLITGGLGTVGLTLAAHLARAGAARVILTSRSGPSGTPGGRRTTGLTRLRALGADVATPRADVTDLAAMRDLLRGERVDGVIHLAAELDPSAFLPLRDLDEATVARHFRAKVDGARVLAQAIGELPPGHAPRWCMLFSSTSALLGGVTLGSYAAANAALAAQVHGPVPASTRWIAVAWDTWPGTLEQADVRIGAAMAAHAMTETQAQAAFGAVLAQGGAAVVVAAGGLTGRLPGAGLAAAEAGDPARYPRPELVQPYAPPLTATERELAEVWSTVLGIEPVGTQDNYFDLGGNSLLALRMLELVRQRLGVVIPTVTLFERPTVHSLAGAVDQRAARAAGPAPAAAARARPAAPAPAAPAVCAVGPAADLDPDRHIAVIGMAGRFPGATDVAQFWANLCDGVESISFFTTEEMIEAGVPAEMARHPSYVAARPVLGDITGFDAGFFGLSPRMAALTDPQQRLFLEVCWEALEQAGYCQPDHRGRVGVFGGCNLSTYLLGMPGLFGSSEDVSPYELVMGNDKDALTTTVSYLFDLRGPSVAVQTFCSTSLVAVHIAVRSLRDGDCEMALAGGVSIRVPDRIGYLYTPGGMESPDGHVRTFDAQAKGSLFGDGAAVVVLKRLGGALRDGDHIWSVIRGSAMNNDGALKVGYTAPSVRGQAAVIADAMADAGISAADVGYVEAHGTATELGDPIEVAALTQAFGPAGHDQYCPIGSVKTNVGHLDRAAGTTGLIKTSLVVHTGLIAPTLHFTTPNPEIDFEHSPFYVSTGLASWPAGDGRPRIAGLNSLGMGGTNVHVVVQQPPARAAQPAGVPEGGRRYQVLPVSARTAEAADAAVQRLGEHLRAEPGLRLADVAYTLQVGRKVFEHRRVTVADSLEAAVSALPGAGETPLVAARAEAMQHRPVAFLLAGVGEQYPGLAGELYRREPAFRRHLDECLGHLAQVLPAAGPASLITGDRGGGPDLAALLGRGGPVSPRAAGLRRTEVAQPLLFAVGYALAATLMEWGLQPAVMLGYSLGEYVAACLAGVLSLPDAIALVAYRSTLVGQAGPGAMAAIPLAATELRERFGVEARGLDIAGMNGPAVTVVAGPVDEVARLAAELSRAGLPARPLETEHAFHSRMLSPLAAQLTGWIAANIQLHPPQRPYLSNVTGGRADAALVCDPAYWARHMCEPVQFAAAATELLTDGQLAVVEIGPGQSLGALLRAADCPPERWPLITATLPAASDPRPADAVLADCLARLWLLGVDVDWTVYHGRHRPDCPEYHSAAPGRVPLPTYPFQRQRYWIERAPAAPLEQAAAGPAGSPDELAGPLAELDRIPLLPEEQWIYLPVWRQTVMTPAAPSTPRAWLVYAGTGPRADQVLAALRQAAGPGGATVTAVRPGTGYQETPDGAVVRPGQVDDSLALLRGLRRRGIPLERVVHLWTLDDAPGKTAGPLARGLYSLTALARATGELGLDQWALDIVTAGAQRVISGHEVRPDAATLIGPALVIPIEYPSVRTRLIDVDPDATAASVADELLRAAGGQASCDRVALRGGRRWRCGYEVVPPDGTDHAAAVLREGGVYLITGGLGGIALGLAGHLARDCRARLVLFGRTGLPPREQWTAIAAGQREAPENVRGRVRRVLNLIELGAEVEVVAGEAAEPGDLRRAVDLARQRFGALHGVLHTAGVPGTGLMQFKEPGDASQVLAPKLGGTAALAAALRMGQPDEISLDFLVLFSSITSVTGGGPGQVDYCAANAYLDAYAARHAAPGRRLISVAWGEWTWNAWDGELSGYDEDIQRYFRQHRTRFGIDFDQGWRTMLRAVALGEPHVLVSTQDLPAVLRLTARLSVAAVTTPATAGHDGTRHPRPQLITPYQEPGGPAEETIAEVWRQALRLEQVGAADNFFELGGTSLLSITLLATLRQRFPGADLSPHVIHEAPTVAALARLIDGGPAASGQDAEVQGRQRQSGLRAVAARQRRT